MAAKVPLVKTDRRYVQQVKCDNRKKGCPWDGLNGLLDEHLQQCQYENVECDLCNDVFERRNIATHQNLNPTTDQLQEGCQNARIRCIYCNKIYERREICTHMNRSPRWEDREKGCLYTPIECKFCKKSFKRQEMKAHLGKCEMVPVSCSFCNKTMQRKEIKLHANTKPTIMNWNEGCQKAVVDCMFCKKRFVRSQLGQHINVNPTEQNWLEGCNDADVKCIYCEEEYKRSQLKDKAKKVEDQLDSKSYNLVVVTSFVAKEKWYEIGLELKIDTKTLNQLKTKHKGSANECFCETIHTWLNSKQHKSWRILIQAVKSSRVGLLQEAKAIERSVICEFAIKSITPNLIKDAEKNIADVNNLLKQAKDLEVKCKQAKNQLDHYQNEFQKLKDELEKYQKEYDEKAASNVSEELSKINSQISDLKQKMSEVRSSIEKNLDLHLQSISNCTSELQRADSSLTGCNEVLVQHLKQIEIERKINLQKYAKPLENTRNWTVGGVITTLAGVGIAAVSPLTGPALPFVLGAGAAVASAGVATTATARVFDAHFKEQYETYNEEQKRINAQYTALAKKCKSKLDVGKETSKEAQTHLRELKQFASEYEAVMKKLDGRK